MFGGYSSWHFSWNLSWHRYLFAVFIIIFLAGCSRDGKRWDPEDYTVKSGDTIFSIAWRYELDAEEFAAWNGFSSAKVIKPGQRLHTRKPANFEAIRKKQHEQSIAYAPVSTASEKSVSQGSVSQGSASQGRQTSSNQSSSKAALPKWIKAKSGDTLYGLSRRYHVSIDQLAQLNQLKKPYLIKPGQTIFLKPLSTGRKPVVVTKPTKVPVVSSNRQPIRSTAKPVSWPKTLRWQRPAKGKVVKRFNRQRNDAKGILIAGKKGTDIVAAAAGKVVYSGNGLISYGNLIIIKHNNTFLSAYAYNQKLLVTEGDVVKVGQKIAEMGAKDKLTVGLHFEIRKNGKPVDPLKYLPL